MTYHVAAAAWALAELASPSPEETAVAARAAVRTKSRREIEFWSLSDEFITAEVCRRAQEKSGGDPFEIDKFDASRAARL